MQKLRKALVISVMAFTVLSMSVVVAPKADAAAVAGDLIKMDGLSSVYFLAADGKRYVFPNESTYFSWYSDFSGVVTIPQAELETYPLGKNVTVRPGTKLVKITTDPKVYAVEPNGILKHVPSEATAITLWGADWAKRVIDVSDAFFTNYTIGSGEVSATAYPAGSLVKFGTSPDVYYIAADGKGQKIASEAAFLANRFKWNDIVTATIAMPTAGADITAAVSTLTDTSSGAGGSAGAGTGLTVALASDTPAAGNIPAGSPNDFLKINLTASNDGAVNVNGIVLTAYDLGTATYIDSATFYDNGIKVGSAKNFTSDRTASFNFATPIAVAAGETKTLLVKATIEALQTGNYAIGIAKAADITTNGAAVSGSFAVRGNTKAIVSGTTIGSVALSSVTSTNNDGAKFGEDNVLLAAFNLAATNEAVLWTSARFKNAGTNDNEIVSNVRLLVDGDEVATAVGITDKYLSFAINNFKIAKGDTVSIEVYGDLGIVQTTNTIDLYIEDESDFQFTGVDYGYGIQLADNTTLDTSDEGIKVTFVAGDFTIDIDKAAVPAADVRAGTDNLVIANLKLKSNSENSTVNYIKDAGSSDFVIQGGTNTFCNEMENAELRDKDTGTVYDMTMASSSAWECTLTMNEEINLVKGVAKTFEVRIDLKGSSDDYPIDANDTVKVELKSSAFKVTGDVSNANITNITPASAVGSIMTVKDASLDWTTTDLTNKTVVPGAKDEVVYQATLEAGDSSYVDLTSVKFTTVTTDGDDSDVFINGNIAQLDLYLNGKLLKSVVNGIDDDTEEGDFVSFTSLPTAERRIAAGATVDLAVKATFSSSFSPSGDYFLLGIHDTAADIIAKDMDNNAVVEDIVNGADTYSRQVTLASTGTLKAEMLITNSKADNDTYILAGGATAKDRYLGEIKFTTANEKVLVKTLVLGQASTSRNDDIKYVKLFDKDGVEKASVAPNKDGHANFSALNLELAADQVTSYFIGIETKTINADGDTAATADFNSGVVFAFANSTELATDLGLTTTAVTARGVDSGQDIDMVEDTNAIVIEGEYSYSGTTTKETLITGSVLTAIENAYSDQTTLAVGTNNDKIIAKYKFVFDNGNNRTSGNEELKAQLRELKLSISSSTAAITVTDVKAYISGSDSNKTTPVSVSGGIATINLTTLTGTGAYVDGEVIIVITADIAGVAVSNSVSSWINSLTTDFTYNGNNGSGANFTNLRLDKSDVEGVSISN